MTEHYLSDSRVLFGFKVLYLEPVDYGAYWMSTVFSPFKMTAWDGIELRAECQCKMNPSEHPYLNFSGPKHPRITEESNCGIYGCVHIDDTMTYTSHTNSFMAVVRNYGLTIVHERGFRTAHAEIVAISTAPDRRHITDQYYPFASWRTRMLNENAEHTALVLGVECWPYERANYEIKKLWHKYGDHQ